MSVRCVLRALLRYDPAMVLRVRVTPETWLQVVEEYGAVLAANNRRMAAQIRSIVPLSDRARFLIGLAGLAIALALAWAIGMPSWFPVFIGAMLLLFVIAYLPRLRRGADAYNIETSIAVARAKLGRFEPTGEDVEVEYELAPTMLLVRAGSDATRIKLHPGMRVVVTDRAAIVGKGVVFFDTPRTREGFTRGLVEICGISPE